MERRLEVARGRTQPQEHRVAGRHRARRRAIQVRAAVVLEVCLTDGAVDRERDTFRRTAG